MIPAGTTSRQLAVLARWTLAIVLMAGALSWWWPSARSWGAMAGGLLVVFLLWVAWKVNRADPTAPASPFHLALAGPAILWSAHFLRHCLLPGHDVEAEGAGTLDISELYQLGLLALAALLSQDLFATRRGRDLPILLCGSAMVVGALTASLWGNVLPLRQSMNLLAFAGVGLWVSVLYSKEQRALSGEGALKRDSPRLRTPTMGSARDRQGYARAKRDPVRAIAVASIVVMFAALAALCPREGSLAAGLLVSAALLGCLCIRSERAKGTGAFLVIVLSALSAGAGAIWLWIAVPSWVGADSGGSSALSVPGWSALGVGGEAFGGLAASTSGLGFLGAAIGWAGAASLGAGVLAAAVWASWRARGGSEGVAAVFRLWSAGMALAAMMAPSGEFVPSVTLAVGFTWGLLFARPWNREAGRSHTGGNGYASGAIAYGSRPNGPPPAADDSPAPHSAPQSASQFAHREVPAFRRSSPRGTRLSGGVLVGLAAVLVLFLALAPDEGLAGWSGKSLGLESTFLHVTSGFLVALVLAWQMGCGKAWKGLLGIGLAIAAGGAAEVSQFLTTTRHPRLGDFLLTAAGCSMAALPYLLALGARMCEEPADDRPL